MRAVILLGLLNGATIALTAIGLVLVFRAQKVVNFAHAQLGVVPMLLLGKMALDWGLNWYLAAVMAIALGALIGALCERLVIRPLADRSRMTLLVATIGLANVLMGISYFEFLSADRNEILSSGYPMPFQWRMDIDSLGIATQHLLTAVIVPSLAFALYLFFKRTTTGKGIRAAAANPEAALLAGLNVRRLSMITWLIAGSLSAISAILAAPNVARFDPASLGPGLMLRALAAAAFGGFTSFPVAFAAGLGLSVVEQLAIHFTHDSGIGTVVLFLGILVGLGVRGRIGSGSPLAVPERVDTAERPLRIPIGMAGSALVRHGRSFLVGTSLLMLFLLPHMPPFRSSPQRFNLTIFLIITLAVASISMLAGWAGQVSLGQYAFTGVGAFLAGRLADQDLTLPVVMLLVGTICAAIAVVIGLPVLRYRGLALAVTTLGFAIVAPYWLFGQKWFTGIESSFLGPPPIEPLRLPGFGRITSVVAAYYVTAFVVGALLLALSAFRRSQRGRMLIAVRDNESASNVFGLSPTVVKVQAFALAAFVAGVAGTLLMTVSRTAAPTAFPPELSLLYLSIAVVGGLGSIAGAVIGTLAIQGPTLFFGSAIGGLFPFPVQFGLFLGGAGMIVALIANPGGIAAVMRTQWERLLARISTSKRAALAADADGAAALPLVVDGVTMKFGEFVALEDVTLDVGPGEVVGLIGNNGAGKTTLINVISGHLTPAAGAVRIFGRDLVPYGPEFRIGFGVSRTFQDARLFPGLTVREILQSALSHNAPVGMISSLTGAPWVRHADRRTRREADAILEQFALSPWADTQAEDLSTGVRRIVDIATQVALKPRLVLLDEPSAGLSQSEAEEFGPVLRRLVAELGCSVLIVEHDMPLMLSVSDRIYCLELGKVIAQGTPGEIRNDQRVIASYLGSEGVAAERSGPVAKSGPRPQAASSARSRTRPARPAAKKKTTNQRRSKETLDRAEARTPEVR